MYCLSASQVLLFLVLCQQISVVYLQDLKLSVETFPLRCGDYVELKCEISGSACCTNTARLWTRDGTIIMNNGGTSAATKYEEKINEASLYFIMKIQDLDTPDFDKSYQCQYDFLSSNIVVLERNKTFECKPTGLCSITYGKTGDGIQIHGTLNISKAAPTPLLLAYYGDYNLTDAISTIVEPTNYDTWYYFMTMEMNKQFECDYRMDQYFKLVAVTGTLTTEICKLNMCECFACGWTCFFISFIIPSAGIVILMVLHCIVCLNLHCGKGEENKEEGLPSTQEERETCCSSKLATSAADPRAVSGCSGMCTLLAMMFFGFAIFINLYATLPIGMLICPCNEGYFQFLNICWACLTCNIAILGIHLCFIQFDWTYLKENHMKIIVLGFIFGSIPLLVLTIFDRKSYKGYCDCSLKRCLHSAGFVVLLLLIFPIPFIIIYLWCLKGDSCWKKLLCYTGYVVLLLLIFPIPFMIIFFWYLKDKNHTTEGERAMDGGNNRSKESGSSCWPPCSVGPDPSSPDPENARSLLKKKADKKNEKKPVAVVRSQPPKIRHVKTDNTESTRYSAETEIFDEGVHKSAKPRPLPSIGQPTISPRPLPQMPPSSQLEKGGIQLEPLGDSTSEKKKKKRRKKKESKQSDEEY